MPRAEPLFLALDQGGHSSRALVFSPSGALLAIGRVAVQTTSSHAGWVEQDPAELLASIQNALGQVGKSLGSRRGELRSAGLATQRSNVVCWDRYDGQALSPAISWQDRRAQLWLEQANISPDLVRRQTGLYASPHYGAGKLRWCIDNLSAVRDAADANRLHCGPLATYLAMGLSADHPFLIDPANAARTLLWNLAARDWDPDLLAAFGLQRKLLPTSVPTHYDYGVLECGGAAVPLRLLTGDQSAAIYAEGRPRNDTLYVNLGTGAFLQRLTASAVLPPEGLLAGIVYADERRADYVLEATINGAGTAFDWARDRLGVGNIESRLSEWLNQEADVPLFLNGVAGLASPWWRPQFISRFVGRGPSWRQAVAVAESIVFLIVENLRLMQGADPIRRIRVSGGLAALDGLCQRLADLSSLPVLRSGESEATARGVAWLLADAEGFGWTESSAEVIVPRDNTSLSRRYERWRCEMWQALDRPA